MKNIKTKLDYINLACSNDNMRPNLACAYREKDQLSATDGHMLIVQSGLPHIENGSYLDGRELQFSDINVVLDSVKEAKRLCTINSFDKKKYKEEVKPLELMLKLKNDKWNTCNLLAEDNKLKFTLIKDKTVFVHEINTNTEHEIDMNIDLSLFIPLLHIGLLECQFDMYASDTMIIVKSADLTGILMTLRK